MASIPFNNLVEPTELTTGLAIVIVSILLMFAYLGFRLKNPMVFIVWFLMIIVLVFTFVTNLSFIWFWIAVMLSAFTVAIAATVRYLI